MFPTRNTQPRFGGIHFHAHFVGMVGACRGEILCRPISLTQSCVLYSTGLDNRRDSLLVLFLISAVKWLVWCSRCQTMFDGSRVDTDQVLRRTRAAVRDRIKLDFVRLNLTEFRTTWCVRGILCDVVDDHLVIHDF